MNRRAPRAFEDTGARMVAVVPSARDTRRPDMSKSSRNATSAAPSSLIPDLGSAQEAEDGGIVNIDAQGDIVLHIAHAQLAHQYRVDAAILKAQSKYFASLLAGHFGESARIEEAHRRLREQSVAAATTIKQVPSDLLPVVRIEDLGRISHVKAITPLCADFLQILHGRDMTALPPPVANLANLAVVADRFDALEHVKMYVSQKRLLRSIDGRTTTKTDAALSEEKVRQRLLVGVLLDYAPWVEKYSTRMIIRGWAGKEQPAGTASALWWDLPTRVEDELAFRRECVLETIQSLQTHFINLYASRERQCKLGYDSSEQCDSFQLGQIIRFFTRIGTIRVQGTLLPPLDDDSDNTPAANNAGTTAPLSAFDGDLMLLLDSLRQASEYQIDRNHTHCGLRTRLIPLLDVLAALLAHVGICGECWVEDRLGHLWINAKRPLVWKRDGVRLPRDLHQQQQQQSHQSYHKEWHAIVRAAFTATERDWSS